MTLTDDMLKACLGSTWGHGIKKCRWCNAQLTGRQKRWCADCRDAWAENHFWTAARSAALRRDGHKCVRCGSEDHLQVHHLEHARGRHKRSDCIHHQRNLETLCRECHDTIHGFRRKAS